jgi:WD40 repeat protein/Flp pilus assembly protein TadD
MKALEKDRTRRYDTANGLAMDIARHLNDEPVVARPPSRVYEFQKTVRRHKFGFAAAAAIILVLAGGVTLTSWQAIRARSAEREQSRLRTDAEKAWRAAQTEARRAETAAADLKLTLSASDFWQGIRLIDQDNAADALPFLARCLSSNPTNDAALTRLTTLLTYRSWLRPMLTVKHEGVVNSAEFSRDGRRIVASSGAKVREWDAATGELLVRPEEPKPKEPKSAEPQIVKPNKTPSGEVARTSTPSQTNSVLQGNNVYSLNTVGYVNTPYGTITFEVKNAEPHFSPDGKSVVKAHGGMSGYGAQLWDAKSGAALAPPMKHYGPVSDTDFSPDGQRIVTASCDSTARVWDSQTAQPVTEPMKHERAVYAAKFSPDGRRIITTTDDKTVRIWDACSGQPLTLPMKRIDSARFSRDGNRIVTASQDRTTRIWDAQNGEPLTESLRNVTGPAQLSPDGNRIVTAPGDNTLWVWDASTARLLVEHLGSFNSIRSIQFSPDGKRIITASSGWTARVWDAQTLQLLADPIRFGRESTGQSWDAQAARPRFLPLELSPDGRRIATVSEDSTARIWDAQTGQALTKPMRHGERVYRAQFSPDGTCLVTVTEPGGVRVWDANTGQSLGAAKYAGGVTSAQLGPDGNRILTVAKEIAQVWDRQTGQPLTTPIKHNGDIRDAHFSPDGRQIVTASADFTARVWDAQTGQPLAELMRHKAEVSIARFSADGKRIVTAASDNTARVWDARTAQPLSDPLKYPEDGVESAQFSPDGKRIVTRASGVVRVWDVAPAQREFPGWLLTLAEAVSGQVLNPQGVLEKTKLNRPETLSRIREQLKQSPGDDDWVVWGRWFFADPATRTISPFSKITVPDYVNRRIQENTVASLEEAIQLSPSNSLAFAKLALLLRFDQSKNAESHARLAVSLDADNGDAWHALGAVLTAKGDLTEAFQAIGRALELSPTNAFAWSVKGEIFENTDQLAEAFAAYSRTIELTVTNTDNVTAYGRGALLNRARVLKQLGRREDAAQDICRAYGIPPREAGARPNLIDLSPFYNWGLKGNWHNDQEDNDLAELPTGVQTLAETQFDVRGLIQLRNGAVLTGIPVAGTWRRIHFLHGAIGAPNLTNTVIGKYVFHYADGTTQERPIVVGSDVLDWWKRPPSLASAEGLTVAWTGENGKSRAQGKTIRLYKTTWENPSPDAALTTIDFIADKKGSSPFLVAITVEP